MTELPVVALPGMEITLYALLAAIGFAFFAGLMIFFAPRFHLSCKTSGLYALLSGLLGLFLGRVLFCLVRMDTLFYDEMGEPLGLVPFFDPAAGSVSIVGIVLGAVLSALLCRLFTGRSASLILDHAALPALFFFAFMRFIEPLSGNGYGIPMEDSPLAFVPFAIINDWGEAMLSVCFLEGLLALLIAVFLFFMRGRAKKPGTFALYAALLFSVSQILPEAFRWDDVLYIFIFARVTHIGLAVMLFVTMLISLIRGKKQGLSTTALCLELLLTLLGVGLCILAIYALDKITAWLPAFVYSGWALVLILLTFLVGRRIHKEDLR